jgi:protein-glutamine gamma-glutamyltransferase
MRNDLAPAYTLSLMMLRKCVVITMALLVLAPALALQAASQLPGIGVSQPVDIPQEYAYGGNAPGTASYYEARYRSAVVSNVLSFQKKMNSGRVAFGRHMDSQYFNTRYWEQVYLEGGQFWKVKDGVSMAEALNDFISPSGGKYKLDCAAAINLILLKSKLDVVGERKFSKHLPALIIRGWKTYTVKDGRLEEYQTLEVWSGDERTPGTPEGLKVGDYVYFKNHPMTEGTPEQGENAIYLGLDRWGRPMFFGLNIGISPGIAHQYGILTTERGTIDPEALKKMAES